MKKLIIAISSLWLLTFSSAMSMELRPSIGLSANMGVYAATGTENNFDEQGSAIDTTTKEHGAFATEFGSVFVELGLSDAISVGVDYVPMALETPQNISNEGMSNESTVEAHFEDLTTVYAKMNLPLGGAYLKVGYTQVEVISKEIMGSTDSDGASSYGNDNASGMTVGLGYHHELAGGVAVRLELTGTDFSDVKVVNGQTNKTEITVKEMIGARGTLSIVKSF